MVGIYKITSPSGRVYIGQSWNIKRRFLSYGWKGHNSQPYLISSFKKYGIKSHVFEVASILPNDVSQEILNNYEIYYWEQYKSCGFNMMNIREPGSKGKISTESKIKMSEKRIELLKNDEYNERNNEHLRRLASNKKGVTNSSEHTAKIIAFHTGRKRSPETCKRISEGKKGKKIKPCTEERKRKLSASTKGKPRSHCKGQKRTPEQIERMRIGMIGKKKKINPSLSRKGIVYRRGRVGIMNYSFGHLN